MTNPDQCWHHVYGRTSSTGFVDKAWFESRRGKETCATCGRLLRGEEIPDIPFEELPHKMLMNLVPGVVIALAHRSLLESLGQEVIAQYLRIGRVLDSHGQVHPDFCTFRGRVRVFFRGIEGSVYRGLCPGCGIPMFHAYGYSKERYLLRDRLPPVPIAESQLTGLIMTSEYLQRIPPKLRKKLQIETLPVIDSPRDGLGDLPF